MRINKIIDLCHSQIRRQGAHATVILRIPGKEARVTRRRLSAKGPYGKILARTHDGKKLIVMFEAAPLTTKLEELRNGRITGGN